MKRIRKQDQWPEFEGESKNNRKLIILCWSEAERKDKEVKGKSLKKINEKVFMEWEPEQGI